MSNIGLLTNNPGNILANGIDWNGSTGVYNSPNGNSYVTFDSPQSGYNALVKDLSTAIGKGYNTPESLVSHYLGTSTGNASNPAPGNYLQAFLAGSGFSPGQTLSPSDAANAANGIAQGEGTTSLLSQVSNPNGDYSLSSILNGTDPLDQSVNNFFNNLFGITKGNSGQSNQTNTQGNNPFDFFATLASSLFSWGIEERMIAVVLGLILVTVSLVYLASGSRTVKVLTGSATKVASTAAAMVA